MIVGQLALIAAAAFAGDALRGAFHQAERAGTLREASLDGDDTGGGHVREGLDAGEDHAGFPIAAGEAGGDNPYIHRREPKGFEGGAVAVESE